MCKRWADMTSMEIYHLKQNQCCRCYYFSLGQGKENVCGTCDYLIVEGHSRGCSPLECVDKGVFRNRPKNHKRKARLKLF